MNETIWSAISPYDRGIISYALKTAAAPGGMLRMLNFDNGNTAVY